MGLRDLLVCRNVWQMDIFTKITLFIIFIGEVIYYNNKRYP